MYYDYIFIITSLRRTPKFNFLVIFRPFLLFLLFTFFLHVPKYIYLLLKSPYYVHFKEFFV